MNTWKPIVVIVLFVFMVVNAAGCSSTLVDGILPRDNRLITTDGFEGVILRDGDWVPTAEEVEALEKQLDAYLAQHQEAFYGSDAPIEERLPTYKRQYWGVLENDRRIVFANFFCDAMHYDWMHEKVVVEDGGDCYFQIRYDVETGTFFDLHVNGSS